MNANENLEKSKNSDIKIADVIGGVVKFGNKTFYRISEGVSGKHGIVSMLILEDVTTKTKIDYAAATLLYMIAIKELKLFLPGDDSWEETLNRVEQHNHILTAIILNNVAIKGNENLIGTKDYDKYLENTLEKANKALERKLIKYAKELYTADQNVLNDMFFSIENFVQKFAATLPNHHLEFNKMVDSFYLKTNPSVIENIEVAHEEVENH